MWSRRLGNPTTASPYRHQHAMVHVLPNHSNLTESSITQCCHVNIKIKAYHPAAFQPERRSPFGKQFFEGWLCCQWCSVSQRLARRQGMSATRPAWGQPQKRSATALSRHFPFARILPPAHPIRGQELLGGMTNLLNAWCELIPDS